MPPHPVFRSGARALITGGASGVGLSIAKLCASHGMALALVDKHSEHLAAAKTTLTSFPSASPQVETYTMDVSDASAWTSLRSSVESAFHGGIDLLVLNAGASIPHTILGSIDGATSTGANTASSDLSSTFRTILDINLFGYVHGLTTLLPLVRAQTQPTAVVLTGSKQGITNPPGNPAYNASKAAVRALAEQLSYELRGSSTSVHLLVPGWTFTGLSGGGPSATKEKPEAAWHPDQVAEYLQAKMEKGSFYVICPDGDVSEDLDKRRMLYGTGDVVYDRPPLSRWREESKDKAQKEIEGLKY